MKRAVLLFCALSCTFLFFTLPSVLPSIHAETGEVRNLSNRRYFDETLRAIQEAKKSIFLVMYHVPFDPSNHTSPVTRLIEALIEAKGRGVRVRAILDQEIRTEHSRQGAPMKNLRAYHFLKENGILVSFDSLAKRTHAKLLVIDEETVIVGSTNWSREAILENYEADLLVRSPQTARELLEDFKNVELLPPEKAAASEEALRIPRKFLTDKNQGPRFLNEHAERALKLYLILLSERSPMMDYDKAAQLLGIAAMKREAYRRQIIKVLKKLARHYELIHFEPQHGKDAEVTVLDPAPTADYFEIPRALFSSGWLESLSVRALYSLLVLYDQASYPRMTPAIEVGLRTLEKKYFLSVQTSGDGFRELAREDLLEIHYGETIDFAKKEFETASYVLLPFYDPLARDQRLRRLEALYGKYAFEKAGDYAAAFFKEKDPDVIETLLGLRLAYSPEWLDLAMKEVILKKSVGNPARSLPYLIGILKQWKETGRPAFAGSSE